MTTKQEAGFLRNFLFVLSSQVIVFISGLIKALIIPVLLGLSDYALWQIYVFYTIYIGVFTLGYGDGLYLKYGGLAFSQLPIERLRASNSLYLILLAIGVVIVSVLAATSGDPNRALIFYAIALNVAVLGTTSIISLTLQATNELKGYAFLNSADKIFFLLALFALVNDDFRNFKYLICADLGAKLIVVAFLLRRYRMLFIGSFVRLKEAAQEFLDSVGAGFQLLLANLSGMLVLGVGRLIVEYFGALDSYAYYAFATSIANVVLMSVTALSIVLYPALRRQPQTDYINYFNKTTQAYAAFALAMLIGYFPAVAFVTLVATQFAPVVDFLNAIFVITVLQGKMQLVNNTYYKALRLERQMLIANLGSLVCATILSVVGFWMTESVLSVAYAALVTMLIRVYASEVFLRKHMGGVLDWRIIAEICGLGVFLLATVLLGPIWAGSVWMGLCLVIAARNRKEIAGLLCRVTRR